MIRPGTKRKIYGRPMQQGLSIWALGRSGALPRQEALNPQPAGFLSSSQVQKFGGGEHWYCSLAAKFWNSWGILGPVLGTQDQKGTGLIQAHRALSSLQTGPKLLIRPAGPTNFEHHWSRLLCRWVWLITVGVYKLFVFQVTQEYADKISVLGFRIPVWYRVHSEETDPPIQDGVYSADHHDPK